jgi:uncharacterized membrane protein YhhN
MSPTSYIELVLLCTALLVASEWRGLRAGIWLFKPLASLAFVGYAWALGINPGPDRWMLAALCACALGDVLLIPRDERAFQAGVATFGAAHAFYAVAFYQRGMYAPATAISVVVLAVLAVQVYRWLAPGVPPQLKPAVLGYCTVITAMVAVSFGTTVAIQNWHIALGALMFFASDLSVARDRFLAPGFANRAWGLPLYYVAQLVLAGTVADVVLAPPAAP